MMKEHNVASAGDLTLEVNWDEASRNDRLVKVKLRGEEAIIKYQDLYSFIFLLGSADEQVNILPVTSTLMEKFIRQHSVKVKRDMRAGEYIVVNCQVDVPKRMMESQVSNLGKKGRFN